jgi:hypothetical protein
VRHRRDEERPITLFNPSRMIDDLYRRAWPKCFNKMRSANLSVLKEHTNSLPQMGNPIPPYMNAEAFGYLSQVRSLYAR